MGTKNYDNATDLITFSRASGGTALRKISYGSELVTNGTFDSDTDWTLNAATISSGNLTFTPTAVGSITFVTGSSAVFSAGKIYKLNYDVLSNNLSSASVRINFGGGNIVSLYSLSVGSHSQIVYAYGDAPFKLESYVNVVAGSFTIDNISVKEVIFDQTDGELTLFNHPTDVPRIEYAPDGTVKGLLVEEARTNLITYSEDFTDAIWATASQNLGVAPVVTADQTTSPDGNTNADRVFFETTGTSSVDRSRLRMAPSTSLTGTGVFSVWIKEVSPGQSDLTIMITNGVGITAVTPTAEWVRYSIPATAFTLYEPEIRLTGSTGTSSDVYIWGAQFEEGSFPTSYIPTSGSTATRAADIASIPVTDFGYNQDAGTVVVEAEGFGSPSFSKFLSLSSAEADRIEINYDTDGDVRMYVEEGNTTQVNVDIGTNILGVTTAKAALSVSRNDARGCVNGGSVVSDLSVNVPTADTLLVGKDYSGGSNYLNGHIKSIQYYPRRLTNVQLQELTA